MEDECPNCGKAMRRRWSYWPYCSGQCVQEANEDRWGDDAD